MSFSAVIEGLFKAGLALYGSTPEALAESKAFEKEYKDFPDGELKRLLREGSLSQKVAAKKIISDRTNQHEQDAALKSLMAEYKDFSQENLEKILRVGNSTQMEAARDLLRRKGVKYDMETIRKIRAA